MFLNTPPLSERQSFLLAFENVQPDPPDRIRRVQIQEADDTELADVQQEFEQEFEQEFNDTIEPTACDHDDNDDQDDDDDDQAVAASNESTTLTRMHPIETVGTGQAVVQIEEDRHLAVA